MRPSAPGSHHLNRRSHAAVSRHLALPQVRAKRLLVIALCLAAGVSSLSSFGSVPVTRAENGNTNGAYNAGANRATAGPAFTVNSANDKEDASPKITATGITQTFTFTGAEQTFAVPAGVSQINVVAIGARGGGGGGFGARASADIATTPGTTLFVEVGGNGLPSAVFGGGAGTPSHSPGGGGGASDVRTCSKSSACSGFGTTSDPRLVVAAGGGGHGGNSIGAGGAGGAAGSTAQPGGSGIDTDVCTNANGDLGGGGGPGGGATLSAGGTGGTGGPGRVPFGDAGIAGGVSQGGTGGNGSSGDGGGGGGGFYGGGGGGSGGRSSCGDRGGGGGGGAGSSYLGPTATNGSITTDSSGTASITITYKLDQTITFAALANKTLGDPDFSVNATASSGLLVSFAASGNCSVTGNTVQITGVGSCTITASQAGDSTYNAAASVQQSFSIARRNQTINFGALADKTFGDPDFAVSANATSTLPVSLGATGNCTLTGNTVQITGAGSCTITASQAGDTNHNAATSVPRSFNIARKNQTINFGALADKTFGDPDFTVNANATSTLPVSFGATGNCTISGNTVNITGGGSCTLTASQAGDSNHNAATSVQQSFNIARANQTINFGPLADKTFGDPDFSVSANATSTLPVSLGATGNCTISGNTVRITGAGSCTVTASQAGDSNYNAATSVQQSFTVARVNQTITFAALTNRSFGDPDFSVNATASSTLPVSFDASGNCTVSGSTVHITGGGSCTVTASQAGDTNYNTATPEPQTFSIARANQTISFATLADKKFADPDFTVSATAASNLSVSFAASGPCSVSSATVHITSFGSCTITASQGGDSNYNAAPGVPQTFGIAQVINGAPDAMDDSLTNVAEDSGVRTISIASLLSNDTAGPANESAQTLTFSLTGGNGLGGTVTSDAINVYFTPAAEFNGPAGFQYTVTDNGTTNGVPDPKADTAAVSFNITSVNDSPAAVNDSLSNVAEDSGQRTITFATLTGNDSKGPANEVGQTILVKTVGNAVGGTVSILGSNILFTPAADYFGPAGFDYTVEDNGTTNGVAVPLSSGVATASFLITEVNDAPVAEDNPLGNMEEDAPQRTIPFSALTGNDSNGPANENGQTLIVKTVSNPVGLTVSIVAGTVRFRPLPNYNGPARFQYTVEDNGTTNGVADPKTSGQALVHFNITAVADTPSVTDAATNANTQTTSGLVISRNPVDGAEVTHFKITGITNGTLFKNDGVTPINNEDFITSAEGNSGLKFTPGAVNGSFTVQASTSAADAGLGAGTASAAIMVNAVGGIIRFSSANYNVVEGAGFKTITVERSGDTSQALTVDYASSDHGTVADFVPCTSPGVGFASSRCDFTTTIGTLRFAPGETSKTFNVLISQDNTVEGPETLELTLSNLTNGAVFGVPQTATLEITDDATESATNPIDNASDFVRQQYHDILHREADAPGLAFWTDNIEKCNGPARRPASQTVAQCINKQRESTAIAFFMSPEFQMTGGFVYRLYKGSLAGVPNYDGGSLESLGRSPTSLEFMRDVTQVSEGIVVNNQIDGAVLEANRNRLAAEFVERPEFAAKYGELNNTLYVQELFDTTGLSEAQFNTSGNNSMTEEKQALVDGLTKGTETRASVLRKLVDGTVAGNEGNVEFTSTFGRAFYEQEYRRVFVYMEYVGYLRRNPDPAGFNFWLNKLNQANGDPFQAEMVKSFIMSPEYRSRFGQP
jgi:hypothetical protein